MILYKMRINVIFRFLVMCVCLVAPSLCAEELSHLFEAEVSVEGQSRDQRNRALREAFIIILNRVAVGEGLMLRASVRNSLNHAASYVDRYQYSTMVEDSDPHASQKIHVSFDEKSLMTLVRESGLRVWGKQRSNVLVWLSVKKKGQHALLNNKTFSEVNKALTFATQLNGIPLLHPLMDLEDELKVSVEDVSAHNYQKLWNASSRYGVDSVLSGKLIQKGRCWHSEWTLNIKGDIANWQVPCEALKANLLTAFQGVYERLSIIYAEPL